MPYSDPEKKKAYNRKYFKKWYAENGRDRAIDYTEAIRDWEKKHPEAKRAHGRVKHALKIGTLKKPEKCSTCHEVKRLSAHHDDYSKPLEVLWLCSSCHKLKHPLDNGDDS